MRLNRTLAAGALFLALGACQTAPGRVVPATPVNALQPLPSPGIQGDDNAALARAYREALGVIRQGNAQLDELRAWSKDVQERFK